MQRLDKPIVLLAALSGVLGVGMGAFAAHGVADPQARELLRTGAAYALPHAAAALAIAKRSRLAALAFAVGGLVFAGSLDLLAFHAPRWVGAVTPVGGLVLIAGWILAGWTGLREVDRSQS
jgi:uncharacterized membrane protein YgdD (TMEM256/DUF423 family)